MSLQFANGESVMMVGATTTGTTGMATGCTSSRGNTTDTDVRQKSISLARVLEDTARGSGLHGRDAGAESDDAVSEKSDRDKRRPRRNSIV